MKHDCENFQVFISVVLIWLDSLVGVLVWVLEK